MRMYIYKALHRIKGDLKKCSPSRFRAAHWMSYGSAALMVSVSCLDAIKPSLTVAEAAFKLIGIGRPQVRSRYPQRLQTRLGDPGPSKYRLMATPGSSVGDHRPGVHQKARCPPLTWTSRRVNNGWQSQTLMESRKNALHRVRLRSWRCVGYCSLLKPFPYLAQDTMLTAWSRR